MARRGDGMKEIEGGRQPAAAGRRVMDRAKRPKTSDKVARGLELTPPVLSEVEADLRAKVEVHFRPLEKVVSDLAAAVDALARRRGLAPDPTPVRLECGHGGAGQGVDQRTRRRGTAAWCACPACNVITLAIARAEQEVVSDGPAG